MNIPRGKIMTRNDKYLNMILFAIDDDGQMHRSFCHASIISVELEVLASRAETNLIHRYLILLEEV